MPQRVAVVAAGHHRAMRGFWSDRPPRGQEDARLLTAEAMHGLRALPYADLRALAGTTRVEDVQGLSGRPFRRRVTVARFTRGGGEELRVLVRVDDGSLLGRLNPLAEEMVLASPDGEMVAEWTMAGEGNDPRRYHFWRRGP